MTERTMDATSFACYLIDHCEDERVTEEIIGVWLANALSNPQYAAATRTQGADDQQLRLIMERDEWRNAMAGLCCGPSENYSTPDKAASHLRKRLHPVGAGDARPVGKIIASDTILGWHMQALVPWEEIGAETLLYATRNTATRAQAPDSAVDAPALIKRICDAIREANNKSVDESLYMLDSDDCIKIIETFAPSAHATNKETS
jgi:hypothetical protein